MQQQVRTLVAAVVKEVAAHGIRLEFLRTEDQPITGGRHVELVFSGRCDKQTFEKAKATLDEENIAGLPLVNQQTRHNDQGEFDPSLGFVWKLYAVLE